ncbi:MAG: hypothetical protein EOO85_22175 [Pedobacter sp.]|nr:MAG: hypothetical protein EOO85_22175 [Pedobacter sp.]
MPRNFPVNLWIDYAAGIEKISISWRLILLWYFKENLKAQITILTKSQINLWLSTLMQLMYFLAQYMFWDGINRVAGSSIENSTSKILVFLVTLAVIDNLYMCLFARGTILLQSLIMQNSLEAILLKPINSFKFLLFHNIDLTCLPLATISLIALAWYHLIISASLLSFLVHSLAIFNGLGILVGISYIYRLSTFWTLGIVSVRYSNPAFKIMVRPWEAFHGNLKVILLTVFPALFITAIPAALTLGSVNSWFIFYGLMANVLVWAIVAHMWTRGLLRYQVKEL